MPKHWLIFIHSLTRFFLYHADRIQCGRIGEIQRKITRCGGNQRAWHQENTRFSDGHETSQGISKFIVFEFRDGKLCIATESVTCTNQLMK